MYTYIRLSIDVLHHVHNSRIDYCNMPTFLSLGHCQQPCEQIKLGDMFRVFVGFAHVLCMCFERQCNDYCYVAHSSSIRPSG